MSNELTIPDWLSAMIDSGSVQSQADKLISSVSSVPRISLKGQKFRFIENGEEVRKENDKIHVVIFGVQPENNMAKTYYEGQYSGDNEPPTCSSSDGVRPDDWVANKQSDLCATCQWNKWGSAESRSGGKAKKCRDSKRLMVGDPKDVANGTIYILNVTVASLKNLSTFGKDVAAKRIPLEMLITTITMDEGADIPILNFSAAGVMKQEPAMAAAARAAKKEWVALGYDAEDKTALPNPATTQAAKPAAQAAKPAAQAAKPTQQAAKPAETTPVAAEEGTGDADLDSLLSKW